MRTAITLLIILSRLIAGFVFIFSGFVKAVDPLGSTYKFIDYFNAFNMSWLEPAAFSMALVLSAAEFTIGVCLILFIQNKCANWAALIFMAFFTPLTFWLALNDPVHDCGCFGDAIILTNWQTFFKNLAILAAVIISFKYRNAVIRWIKLKTERKVSIIIVLLITGFSLYNYYDLPIIDFRPYKIGTNIPEKMKTPKGTPAHVYEQYFTLMDTINMKMIDIESQAYMADSTYWGTNSNWKFVRSGEPKLIKQGYQPPIHNFSIESISGLDITQEILTDPSYYFIVISYDLKKSRTKHQPAINLLYDQATADGHKFIGLTSSGGGKISTFKNTWNIGYEFYLTDPITLKTIVRANPGLIILHKGTIVAKWNVNSLPSYQTIKSKYLNVKS